MTKPGTFEMPAEYQTTVFVDEKGLVHIEQDDPGGADPSVVIVSVQRVDELVRILLAARDGFQCTNRERGG